MQIFDAFVMTMGVILLTSVSSPSLNGFVIALAWSFFVYGVGVGGEYVGDLCACVRLSGGLLVLRKTPNTTVTTSINTAS